MKRRLSIGIAVLVTIAVTAAPANALTVKLGTVAPEGSPWHDALKEMGAAWKQMSGGKVKLRIYAGGVAGDEPDLLRKIRIGQLHAAALTKSSLVSLAPDIDLISFPMMLRSDDELDHLLDRFGPAIEARLEQKGLKVLNWSSAGWVYFFSREPVLTPEDLQEQKIFFWGSDREYLKLLKNAGFQPIPLAINDLLPSLQTGLVEAFGAPPVAALSFQWFALTPHMADLRWQPLPGATLISVKTWKKIPANMRPDLERVSVEIGAKIRGRIAQLNDEAIKAMKEHGLRINAVTPEGAEYWASQFHLKGGDEFIDKRHSRKEFEEVEKTLREYRRRRSP